MIHKEHKQNQLITRTFMALPARHKLPPSVTMNLVNLFSFSFSVNKKLKLFI